MGKGKSPHFSENNDNWVYVKCNKKGQKQGWQPILTVFGVNQPVTSDKIKSWENIARDDIKRLKRSIDRIGHRIP